MKVNSSASLLGAELARFSRPQDFSYAGLLCVLSGRLYGNSWVYTIGAATLLFCLYTIAVCYNNLKDTSVDTTNKRRDNPLAAGTISKRTLYTYIGILLAAVVLLTAVMRNTALVYAVAIYGIMTVLYSHEKFNVQARGIFALFPLAICYGCLPIIIGAGTFDLAGNFLLAIVLQIPLLLPMLLAKDYKDLRGDAAHGKRTFLVRHGVRKTQYVAGALLAGVTAIIIYLSISRNFEYQVVVSLLSIIYAIAVLLIHLRLSRISPLIKRLAFSCLLGITLLIAAQPH